MTGKDGYNDGWRLFGALGILTAYTLLFAGISALVEANAARNVVPVVRSTFEANNKAIPAAPVSEGIRP